MGGKAGTVLPTVMMEIGWAGCLLDVLCLVLTPRKKKTDREAGPVCHPTEKATLLLLPIRGESKKNGT